MAETLLLSAFLPVVMEKATDFVLEQFGAMWGIQEKLEKLERLLSAIQDIVGDAEQRQVKEAGVRSWLAAMKNAAYEADDILDEFKLEAMRRRAEIRIDMRKKVRSFFSFHDPASFRLMMGRKLNDVVEKIEAIANERNTFHFEVKTQPPNKPQTHSYVAESDVFIGREKEKEAMVKLLLDPTSNQNVAILPIVGMGGLGKTTLVRWIYKDERVGKHFQPLMWVCVSDEFDVAKLAKAIIASATKTEPQKSDMESLQRLLREAVSGKRYLLVLDDVWNEDRAKWDELKTLLETGGEGSRIIVTTRSDHVSQMMGTLDACHLDCLNNDDSWELFKKLAKPPRHLESIGKEIVQKCGRLPLALKTLGSLMHSKSQEGEWSSVRDSEIWDLQVGEDGILPALRLSYSHLPSHLKQCFAFCAIFPKDYVMKKDLLIQLWMANGFIPSDGRKELEEKGHDIFNELASRSFFQEIKMVEEGARHTLLGGASYTLGPSRHELYCIMTCKMHDLMHDLARFITRNECHSIENPAMLENISRKTRHLRAYRNVLLNNYPNIRTLLSFGTVTVDSSKPRSLRALGLHRIGLRGLPISIRFLKHLRYLDLSKTSIKALPNATSTLLYLQTLKLSKCERLHKLPEDMRNMNSLRHLYIDDCPSLKHLPVGIGQLNNLQTLTKYIVGNNAGRRIGELNSLNLGGHLELYNLRNVNDAIDAKKARLNSKHNLHSLVLCWDIINIWDNDNCYTHLYRKEKVFPVQNAEGVLEALRPHCGLKLLGICCYEGGSFPTWMDPSLLQNLVEIHLRGCTSCEHLPPLWELPALKFLHLIKMDSLKHICSSTVYGNASNGRVQAFPSLKRLVLNMMQSLERWSEYEGIAEVTLVFPHLAELTIIDCPNLITIPELPSLKSLEMKGTNKQLGLVCSLNTLSSLQIEVEKTSNGKESRPLAQKKMSFRDFRSLENLTISKSEDLVPLLKEEEETRGLSSSLHHLNVDNCNWLFSSSSQHASSPLGFWNNLTSLVSLKLWDVDDLVYWPEEFSGLDSLKTLNIFRCDKFVGLRLSSSSPGDGELLQNLENLSIDSCDELLELPKLPASLRSLDVVMCDKLSSVTESLRQATALEELKIAICPSMTSLPLQLEHHNVLTRITLYYLHGLTCLPEGFGQLTALKCLHIGYCDNLSYLPEGMHGLTALQDLRIVECPRLSSLPEGLQQQLPNLQTMHIERCPNLERRYAKGGPYWDLISFVPDTGTLSETRSNCSTFLPSLSCFGRPSTV